MSEQKRVMDADPPERMRNLRACLSCKLVKTYDQFVNDGCENCPDYQRVQRFTTPTFHGLIAMTDPNKSWVAKWQTQEKLARGCYAVTVVGKIPDPEEDLE